MTVIKMRGSEHSQDLRLYDVTAGGLVIGETLHEYRGIITGVARRHLSGESEDTGERMDKVFDAVRHRVDLSWVRRLRARVRRMSRWRE